MLALRIFAACCLLLGTAVASKRALAAQVVFLQVAEPNQGITCDLRLTGVIEAGDLGVLERHLRVAKERNPVTTLCLDSPGGNFREALLISEMIMQFGVNTALEAGAVCESACAFVFMAGTEHRSDFHGPKRMMHAAATLGFHAEYISKGVARTIGKQLDQLRSKGREDRAVGLIYEEAINNSRLILTLLARTEYDRYTFVRRPWIKPSLIAELLKMGPDEFFFVDTVGKAGNYDIEITGYRPRSGDISEHVDDVCRNLHKWQRDTFAGVDIPVRSPPSGWSAQEEREFRRALLGEEEARTAFVEVEDGGGGGPICGLRLDDKREPLEEDCDQAQLAVRGPWGGDLSNLKSFCVEGWQQYHFGTKLADIAASPLDSKIPPAAIDAAGTSALRFFDAMSRPASEALEILDDLYAETVDYYGRKRSHDEVMQDRKAFFDRWPDRAYVAEWGQSTSRCSEPGACKFDGKVHFDRFHHRPDTNVQGVAQFTLRFSPDGAKVVSEDETGLSRDETTEPFMGRWSFESELVE